MTEAYDVLVIGGGPGGYVAAIRARQLGLRTALVERSHLGGICLNWGCIPTKAMLKGSELLHHANHAARYGVDILEASLTATSLVTRAGEVSRQLSAGIAFLLKKNGVDLIWGEARLVGPGEVAVTESPQRAPHGSAGPGIYHAAHVILATGAAPRQVRGLEVDGHLVWSYFEALRPDAVPASLLVVGSGAIGVEFASIYRALGAEVTLVEQADRVLPTEDPDISAAMAKALEKQGITVRPGVTVTTLDRHADAVTAAFSDGSSMRFDRVLSAVGVVPNTDGFEALGVALRNGAVVADDAGRTNVPGLYAIGDLAGPPMLAHKAEHEGVRCIEAIAGRAAPVRHGPIPGCIYASPQVASVGMTEAAARAAGHDVRVGRFSYRGNGKALVIGEPDGLCKTVFDAATDRLLGAQIIGAEASELIHGLTIAIGLAATSEQLAAVVFPHPTVSEVVHESVLAAREGAIHA